MIQNRQRRATRTFVTHLPTPRPRMGHEHQSADDAPPMWAREEFPCASRQRSAFKPRAYAA